MIPGYPELALLRGVGVSFLEHPAVYSKDLIGEGFFNRLLGDEGFLTQKKDWLLEHGIETKPLNLYSFVANNPIGSLDLFGLSERKHRFCYKFTGHMIIKVVGPNGTFWFDFHPAEGSVGNSLWPLHCDGQWSKHSSRPPLDGGANLGCVCITAAEARRIEAAVDLKVSQQGESYGALHRNCYQAAAWVLGDAIGADELLDRPAAGSDNENCCTDKGD